MTKAVMFDLDGTLINSIEDLGGSMNHALRQAGFAERTMGYYEEIIGGGVYDFACQSLPEDVRDDETIKTCVKNFQSHYRDHWAVKTDLYDGMAEVLDFLTENKVPMAVLSNKPDDFVQMMAKHFLADWSWVVISGAVEGKPHKPDPVLALELAEQMKVLPEHVFYVGDTEVDVRTAKNAGFQSVAALWGFRDTATLMAENPDQSVQKPLDLKSMFVVECEQ